MSTTRLHGTSSDDLLAIPVIMLGFHPRESCVVLGVREGRVEFCARMNLDWFTHRFDEVAEQLHHAVSGCQGCRVAVLAYTNDPEWGAVAAAELVAVMGGEHVLECLVTDGDRYWYAYPGVLLPPGGLPYSYVSSNLAAQAVYSGLNVTDSREQAVAEVQPPADPDDVRAVVDLARLGIGALGPADAMRRLAHHVRREAPLPSSQAAELAVLVADEERFAETLAQLTSDSARTMRPRLAEARRCCSDDLAPNVLALLVLACWLDGEGAQQSDCLSQLEVLEPRHPLMSMLRTMHRRALPPPQWAGNAVRHTGPQQDR